MLGLTASSPILLAYHRLCAFAKTEREAGMHVLRTRQTEPTCLRAAGWRDPAPLL